MKATTKKIKTDLADSKRDKKLLQPDEGILNLPEVKDIPAQEHIRVPALGALADVTISSDDEEGRRIFEEDEAVPNNSDVSPEEKNALRDAAEKTPGVIDDENREESRLDDRDEEGELLNEKTKLSGRDLDIPGGEDDDDNEDIGEEDEENNYYSMGGEEEDESVSRQ